MNLSKTSKSEWLNEEPEDPTHGKIKRTIEILDELETRDPLVIETLVSEDGRRGRDELEDWLDEQIQVDPYECHASSKRSEREVSNLLAILDNLDRKEITQ